MEGDAEKGAKDAEGLDGARRELAEADARHLLGTDGEEDEGEGLVRTIDDAAALESTGVAATAHSDVHSAKCCKLAPCGLRDAGAAEH